MKIVWSPLAVARVAEIAHYIAQDKPSAAQQWVEVVFAKVEHLMVSSEGGRIVPEVQRKEIRELLFGNYRVIYRIEPKRISILTVRHSRQILPVDEIDV